MIKNLTITILLSMVACGHTTITPNSVECFQQKDDKWETFDHPAYSIQYPSTWELNQSEQAGTSFFILAPLESENDNFRENLNLVIQDLSGHDINLDKFTEISEGQVKTMITNSNLIESKRIKSGNNEYHKIIYSGEQGIYLLTFIQYYWVINNKAYVLTFTSEQEKYAEIVDTAVKMLNSFKFK